MVHTATTIDTGWWLKHGVIGGIIAGLVFAAFEMAAAAFTMGPEALFMPLRMIGGIALGPQALDPTYPLLTASTAGVLVHVVLSAIFGAVLGLFFATIPALASSDGARVLIASVFGLGLWIVNFFVIAPIAGWTWFPERTDPIVQVIAHTVFFGAVLGVYLNAVVHAHAVHTARLRDPVVQTDEDDHRRLAA
jgi:hypothetical protein